MNIDKLLRYATGLGLVGALSFACTGNFTFDQPNDPGPDAAPDAPAEPATPREYFDQKVAPVITAQCGCHDNAVTQQTPIFVGASYDESYNYLKDGYPDTSLIRATPAESSFYTKAQQPHYNSEWKDNQATYVSEWITWEYDYYSNPPPPESQARQLFDTNIVPLLAKCSACHSGATAPQLVGGTPDESYTYLKAGYPSTLVGADAPNSRFYAAAYPDPHQGSILWEANEAGYIEAWIAEEYAEYSAGQ